MYKILTRSRGVKLVEFYNQNNFHVILSNYGASIYEIDMEDRNGEAEVITLSPQSAYYFSKEKYAGLTVGRTAGRIKDAEFEVDGVTYKFNANDRGNLLHGGDKSMAFKFFDYTIDDNDEETIVTYSTYIKDMEDGFPGNLEVKVIYTLKKLVNQIQLEFKAYSDKDTMLNLTNHSYFNLYGNLKRTIENHVLTLNKNYISKMDETQALLYNEPVSKEYDFRKPKEIGQDLRSEKVMSSCGGYDDCWTDSKPLRLNLYDKESGRNMEIESNYHDVVIYTNNMVNNITYISGVNDSQYLAVAIEPSRASKAITKKDMIQKARQLYDKYIIYKFTIR